MPATVEKGQLTSSQASSPFGYGDGHGESPPPINKSSHGPVPSQHLLHIAQGAFPDKFRVDDVNVGKWI
jgi:hypothetical protein